MNRGFKYADAVRIVRPELTEKLIATACPETHENRLCVGKYISHPTAARPGANNADGALGGAA